MEKVLELINKEKLFKPGSIVGVGVSGGSDSMALLHFLNRNKEKLDIDVVAINVIHGTRENDESDAIFVQDYCRENNIRFYKFRIEAAILASQKGLSMEDACREGRFGVFENLKKRGIVDYIALAHHQRDQAETILLHILRGSGLKGASGMSYIRDDFYVRPFLDTPKDEILQYVYENNIDYLEDETNADTTISRNLLRQQIMPVLRTVWPQVDANLSNFGKVCKEDDSFIRNLMHFDGLLEEKNIVKIPLTYFVYSPALVMRLLSDCMNKLGVTKNIERKHFEAIINLAKKSENGAKINLPENIDVYREYDYITIARKRPRLVVNTEYDFKIGTITFGDYGKLKVSRAKTGELVEGSLLIDLDKVPENAKWRIRKEGDFIEKFGGGVKKLKTYFMDKKIPVRLRNYLPVLAVGSEVLAVAGVDISEQLRVTETTKKFGLIKYNMQNWA